MFGGRVGQRIHVLLLEIAVVNDVRFTDEVSQLSLDFSLVHFGLPFKAFVPGSQFYMEKSIPTMERVCGSCGGGL